LEKWEKVELVEVEEHWNSPEEKWEEEWPLRGGAVYRRRRWKGGAGERSPWCR